MCLGLVDHSLNLRIHAAIQGLEYHMCGILILANIKFPKLQIGGPLVW